MLFSFQNYPKHIVLKMYDEHRYYSEEKTLNGKHTPKLYFLLSYFYCGCKIFSLIWKTLIMAKVLIIV